MSIGSDLPWASAKDPDKSGGAQAETTASGSRPHNPPIVRDSTPVRRLSAWKLCEQFAHMFLPDSRHQMQPVLARTPAAIHKPDRRTAARIDCVKRPIRLIAIDIDGTLLDSKVEISPANLNALRRAHEAGVEIVLGTGRRHKFALPIAESLGFDLWLISSNGAVTRSTRGELFHQDLLPQEHGHQALPAYAAVPQSYGADLRPRRHGRLSSARTTSISTASSSAGWRRTRLTSSTSARSRRR